MRKVVLLILTMMALSLFAMPAFAQGGDAAASGGTNWVAITSGFAMAFAAALAALGQGRVASAACEGLARNPAARPGIQIALFVGLAFIESLVLFTFLIIFVKVVSRERGRARIKKAPFAFADEASILCANLGGKAATASAPRSTAAAPYSAKPGSSTPPAPAAGDSGFPGRY